MKFRQSSSPITSPVMLPLPQHLSGFLSVPWISLVSFCNWAFCTWFSLFSRTFLSYLFHLGNTNFHLKATPSGYLSEFPMQIKFPYHVISLCNTHHCYDSVCIWCLINAYQSDHLISSISSYIIVFPDIDI